MTLNVLLFGPPGIGKSTGAASSPGPILYLNVEGQGGIRFARRLYGDAKIAEVAITGKRDLDDAYLTLRDGKHPYKTVVLDSVGELYRVLTDEGAGATNTTPGRGATPQIQHYGDAGLIVERFVRALRDLPINVVLVAHEITTKTADGPILMPDCGGNPDTGKLHRKTCAMVDVVAYVGVQRADDGTATYMGQLAPGGGRYAKDRNGGLGVVRALDVSEWIATKATALAPVKAAQ